MIISEVQKVRSILDSFEQKIDGAYTPAALQKEFAATRNKILDVIAGEVSK